MAKKLKKAKTGMNPKVKYTIGSAFKGLISNQSVIDGSKNSPWWVAAIFFAFSALLPLVPNFVQLSKLSGNSFINNLNFGLDEQLSHFVFAQRNLGVEFKVEGGYLSYYENNVKKEFVDPSKDPTYFTDAERKCEYKYINTNTHQIDVKFYFWVDANLTENANKITRQTYIVGGEEIPVGAEGEKVYLPNIVIFTPSTMAVSLYKDNSKDSAGASYGGLDWKHYAAIDKGLIERLIGEEALKDLADNPDMSEDTFVNKYKASTLTTFKAICNETYLTQKSKTKWTNTGIYLGIYGGVILFLGLMVFILTRGKNNPYKFLNIWDCQKISWWGAVSPAIIGTLLSLIFSGNAIGQMAFILVLSLRIMWLSMKQLRPVVQ